MAWNATGGEAPREAPKFEDYWKKPDEIVHKTGLKVLAWGEPEVGKTHFGLTCPEPIYVVDTEFGIPPLLAKEPFKSKDIRVFEAASLDLEGTKIDPVKSIDKTEEAITLLRDVDVGTVMLDSATDYWQWLGAWLETEATRRTQSGRIYRFEWGKANARYRKLILRLMAMPKVNVILTGQPSAVYDTDGRETGFFRPRVQKQTGHLCDIILHMTKQFDKMANSWQYVSTIKKCRFQRGFEAEIIDCTYEGLLTVLKEKLGVVIG